MAELPEWSAQALRYQGSDGPVKVIYFQSRVKVTNDSFDQNSASPKERPELSEHISFKASGSSDTRGVLSGHLFDVVVDDAVVDDAVVDDAVEVLDSKNYQLQREEYFEDRLSALEDLASKFNNSSTVLPFDIKSSYEPGIKPLKEGDLIFNYFRALAIIAKDFKGPQDFKDRQDFEDSQDFKEFLLWKERREVGKKKEKPKKEEYKKKEEEKDGKEAEEKVEKKEIKENKDSKLKEEEENERQRILQTRKELDGMQSRERRQGFRCQCALIFGITTKFNPSGMWIVDDIIYDEEERE